MIVEILLYIADIRLYAIKKLHKQILEIHLSLLEICTIDTVTHFGWRYFSVNQPGIFQFP